MNVARHQLGVDAYPQRRDGDAALDEADHQRVGQLAQAAGDCAAVAGDAQHAVFQLHDANMACQRCGQDAIERCLGVEQHPRTHGKPLRQLACKQVGKAG